MSVTSSTNQQLPASGRVAECAEDLRGCPLGSALDESPSFASGCLAMMVPLVCAAMHRSRGCQQWITMVMETDLKLISSRVCLETIPG